MCPPLPPPTAAGLVGDVALGWRGVKEVVVRGVHGSCGVSVVTTGSGWISSVVRYLVGAVAGVSHGGVAHHVVRRVVGEVLHLGSVSGVRSVGTPGVRGSSMSLLLLLLLHVCAPSVVHHMLLRRLHSRCAAGLTAVVSRSIRRCSMTAAARSTRGSWLGLYLPVFRLRGARL